MRGSEDSGWTSVVHSLGRLSLPSFGFKVTGETPGAFYPCGLERWEAGNVKRHRETPRGQSVFVNFKLDWLSTQAAWRCP